jgi:hypothetical protein
MATKRQLEMTEQRIWDEIFVRRFDRCMDEVKERGLHGCAQWAVDQADAAIAARRGRFNYGKKS